MLAKPPTSQFGGARLYTATASWFFSLWFPIVLAVLLPPTHSGGWVWQWLVPAAGAWVIGQSIGLGVTSAWRVRGTPERLEICVGDDVKRYDWVQLRAIECSLFYPTDKCACSSLDKAMYSGHSVCSWKLLGARSITEL